MKDGELKIEFRPRLSCTPVLAQKVELFTMRASSSATASFVGAGALLLAGLSLALAKPPRCALAMATTSASKRPGATNTPTPPAASKSARRDDAPTPVTQPPLPAPTLVRKDLAWADVAERVRDDEDGPELAADAVCAALNEDDRSRAHPLRVCVHGRMAGAAFAARLSPWSCTARRRRRRRRRRASSSSTSTARTPASSRRCAAGPCPAFASPSFTEPETLLFSHATQATPSSAPQLLPFSAAAVERYDLRSLAVDLECAAGVDAVELLLTFETTDDRDHAWSLVERAKASGDPMDE